jgi:hypothetical protein
MNIRPSFRSDGRTVSCHFDERGDQFIPALADILAVEDLAGEDAREIEPVGKAGIRPVVDRERTVQPDSGPPDTAPSQPPPNPQLDIGYKEK